MWHIVRFMKCSTLFHFIHHGHGGRRKKKEKQLKSVLFFSFLQIHSSILVSLAPSVFEIEIKFVFDDQVDLDVC